jgi:hypothetical protein
MSERPIVAGWRDDTNATWWCAATGLGGPMPITMAPGSLDWPRLITVTLLELRAAEMEAPNGTV